MACELAPKDPQSVTPYQMDLTRYLDAHNRSIGAMDAIASVEVVPVNEDDTPNTATTINIESVQFTTAGLVTVWVSGGEVGETVRLRVRFTGTLTDPVTLIDDRTIMFRVMNQ